MRRLLLILCLLPALAFAVEVTPLLDVRVRQEVLDGVFHFAPDPDRNWIRVRTRGGGELVAGDHTLRLRLTNEHRHILHPDQDFSWDEVILDHASWRWQLDPATDITVGRQDIIWPGGFVVLEGHPLDGSRSIYQNAVRAQTQTAVGGVDLALVRNLKRDQLVLVDDQDRALADADESGFLLRLYKGSWTAFFIGKYEKDPDLVLEDRTTTTLGGRFQGDVGAGVDLEGELAFQRQKVEPFQHGGLALEDQTGGAWAWQLFAKADVGRSWQAEAGGFFYSGGEQAFRAPWGRWPKWSELYIYSLIGESTPGRVTVATWENVAAPRLQMRRPVHQRADLRLGVTWLLAPEPDWEPRGLLTQAELKTRLGAGFTGHLLWEMLLPGRFHYGTNGLPPLTDTVHFLRWQISWSL